MAIFVQSDRASDPSESSAFRPGPEIKRLILLGQSGFIGTHLARHFRTHLPEIELIGRSAPQVDLTRENDVMQLADLLDLQTAVVMLAGVKRQLGDNLETFLQNLKMAVNLGRVLQDNPVRRFVFFSSAAVYGEEIHNTSITEATPVRPTSFYGAAKFAAECLFERVISGSSSSSLLILRPPVIYGPGDTGHGYGPSGFVTAASKDETITLWGDGTEQREFIFVEDAAEIVCCLMLGNCAGVVNLASGRSYTYLDVLSMVSNALGKEVRTATRPRSKPKVDHGFCNANLTKLLPDFTFTALDKGIQRLVTAR